MRKDVYVFVCFFKYTYLDVNQMLLVKEPLVLRQAPKGQEEEVGRRLAPPSVMDHMVRSTETLPSSIPGDRTSVRHEQGKKKRKI